MSRRKTPRLAPPEYVSRDPNKSSQVYWARIQLLEAVQRVYPAMLERLSADVFPHYLRLETRFDFDRMLSAPGVSPWKAFRGDRSDANPTDSCIWCRLGCMLRRVVGSQMTGPPPL